MIIETINELRNYLEEHRKTGKTIGFVPTMGFLHEGHLSLIRAAKAENDVVVVSDFVNPTQFAPNEDFESYPRNIEQDEKMAMEAGADVIFFPSVEEMYPNGSSTFVEVEGEMTKILCGKSRPSHFKGVTTVVNILFNIVQPNKAYFGQKDAQQVAVLIKMVRDLHQNLEIVVCPIVREKDGLAMSSRNTYLDTQQRKDATILYQSLQEAELHFKNGENNVGNLTQFIRKKLSEKSSADIDYIEIYDFPSLTKIEKIDHKALAAIAVRFGKTRLIDNIILEKK
jgi:pantoate--beta-alanine ligase